ncbi:MAG: hypothetical protein ABI782_11095 [Anaerolineaceae bacterium]
MSQLQKKMQKLQRREGPSMGFGAAAREQPRAMVLIALTTGSAEAKTALGAGADAVAIRAEGSKAVSAVESLADAKGTAGVLSQALEEATAAALAKVGCDFVISSLEKTESIAVDTERMGHILIASEEMEDNTLRALAPLGIDGLFVERGPGGTMLANQLGLVRLATFASTPLLVTVPANASVAELRVLRDSGVGGVIAPENASAGELKALIEALIAVPAPKKSRRDGGEMAIVPSAAAGHAEHEEEDDEEDDE